MPKFNSGFWAMFVPALVATFLGWTKLIPVNEWVNNLWLGLGMFTILVSLGYAIFNKKRK